MDVAIYIPTLGRWDRQPTLDCLPEPWIEHTSLVISRKEIKQYQPYTERVKVFAPPVSGIHNVRQWIFENSPSPHIIVLSDDLKFFRRAELSESKKYYHLTACSGYDTHKLLMWMLEHISQKGYAHAGISQRQVNNTTLEKEVVVTRMHDAYAYHRDVILEDGFRVDRLEVMEDLDLTLQLLEAGYPNIVNFYYAWDQMHSNAEGGCSTYRNNELQAKCAEKLAELHPGIVKVVEKKTKSWKGMETRKDVRVQWKKAYIGDL